ncbi:hypothetical protein B7O87_09635 [Cylindrospermopsis raciborskii CENA303]|uniref:Uncharacterized protein n=1 Tax=Cylindrospermopsis raciborskii CENA303 TaxID=1170769 RepID=A0A1X4G681_9CYAN|nr:hypothetical protein B7O87_09635 [Cylindrospermopsis raciborskii CENA303]
MLSRIGFPPQPPLKRGAFRLNVLCKNMLSGIGSPPQPPLKRGTFRLNVLCDNMAAHRLVFSV